VRASGNASAHRHVGCREDACYRSDACVEHKRVHERLLSVCMCTHACARQRECKCAQAEHVLQKRLAGTAVDVQAAIAYVERERVHERVLSVWLCVPTGVARREDAFYSSDWVEPPLM